MYPGPIELFGIRLATWDILFLVGVLAGYVVLKRTPGVAAMAGFRGALFVRYMICVYVCALGAQWFAYAFDSNTTLLPPDGFNAWRYYFHPLAGPKTLYGAILLLPVAAAVAFLPTYRPSYGYTLDRLVPALFTILGCARIGCFLQGCCYGLSSERFGVVFPPGSSVHADQVLHGVTEESHAAIPVLATQIPSALACFLLAVWTFRLLKVGEHAVFVRSVAIYSVFRFAIEFFRADDARNHLGALSTSQWIALAVLLSFSLLQSRRTARPA